MIGFVRMVRELRRVVWLGTTTRLNVEIRIQEKAPFAGGPNERQCIRKRSQSHGLRHSQALNQARNEASPHCESHNSQMGVFAIHPAGGVCHLSNLSTPSH